jgi:tetratricopeptide (TPR) repeat protein
MKKACYVALGFMISLCVEIIAWRQIPHGLVTALCLHALAAALFSGCGYFYLPIHYRRKNKLSLVSLIGTLTFFIPLIGSLIVIAGMALPLRHQRSIRRSSWQTHDVLKLPYKPIDLDPNAMTRRAGLIPLLYRVSDPQWRKEAILGCRELDEKQAVPILRTALADPADEVRLLAHLLLTSKERKLSQQLDQLLKLDKDPDPQGDRQEQLAYLYWDFVYLELTTGEVAQHLLHQALSHIETAIVRLPSASRYLLRARIQIALDQLQQAKESLSAAYTLGMPQDNIAIYLAEVAFKEGHYKEVRSQLERMTPLKRQIYPINKLQEFWL